MSRSRFLPIKTHDVVVYNGSQYIVSGVDVTPSGAVAKLQPISPQSFVVPVSDVQLANPVENGIRTGVFGRIPNRLVAAQVAKAAWINGAWKAKTTLREAIKSNTPLSRPMSVAEVERAIKSAIRNLARRNGEPVYLTQKTADAITKTLASIQSYRVSRVGRAEKSRDNWARWEDIARSVVRIGNNYNKALLLLQQKRHMSMV